MEALLATATTRPRWATSHFALALAGVAVLMLRPGRSGPRPRSLADGNQLGRVVAAAAQIPAAWVMTSPYWPCSAGRRG